MLQLGLNRKEKTIMTLKFINGISINAASERIDYPAIVMAVDKAIDLASKLNSDTLEDWRYVVNPLGDSGNAKIEVIDENGEFVSYL
jgi:hypothetical protein